MDKIVSLKTLRENMAEYAEHVEKGKSFIVVKRSKPLFRISPVNREEGWETVIDFTGLRKSGVSAAELLKRLKSIS